MLTDSQILHSIVEMVPHWFVTAPALEINVPARLRTAQVTISMNRRATPDLHHWLRRCLDLCQRYVNQERVLNQLFEKEILQTNFAVEWLKIAGHDLPWNELFNYNMTLEKRTYENEQIGFTFIVDGDDPGTTGFNLLSSGEQKTLDVLTESQYTYFRVNKKWEYLSYESAGATSPPDAGEYHLSPEFIYPYQVAMQPSQSVSIIRTKRGDLLIFNKHTMLAGYRKGGWIIYEASQLKNFLSDSIEAYGGTYRLGANLFEIIFDLSYRRHGALICIKPMNVSPMDFVVNPNSILAFPDASQLRLAIRERVSKINVSSHTREQVSKPLLLELASMDGALVLSETGKVLSFGSMIQLHQRAHTLTGARSTAAVSAFHHGLMPIKVSSDGEITIYHRLPGRHDLVDVRFL